MSLQRIYCCYHGWRSWWCLARGPARVGGGWGSVCFEFSDLKRLPMAICPVPPAYSWAHGSPGCPGSLLHSRPCPWPLLLSPEKRSRKEVGDPRDLGPQPWAPACTDSPRSPKRKWVSWQWLERLVLRVAGGRRAVWFRVVPPLFFWAVLGQVTGLQLPVCKMGVVLAPTRVVSCGSCRCWLGGWGTWLGAVGAPGEQPGWWRGWESECSLGVRAAPN